MFKDKLKELRKSKGLTQKQLAEQLNITTGALANYECGSRQPRTRDDWVSIANYFNVSVDYLMDNQKQDYRLLELLQESYNLSDNTIQMINNLITLSPCQQATLSDIINHLAKR